MENGTSTTMSESSSPLDELDDDFNTDECGLYLDTLKSRSGSFRHNNSAITDRANRIRKSSKELHGVKLQWSERPQTVLIIKKFRDYTVSRKLKEIAAWLVAIKGMRVYVESTVLQEHVLILDNDFAPTLKQLHPLDEFCIRTISDEIDFIVCLGGDGTILYASSLFQHFVPPVISFHMGSMGFLMPFDFKNYVKHLNDVLDGHCHLTMRARLQCEIFRTSQSCRGCHASTQAGEHIHLGQGGVGLSGSPGNTAWVPHPKQQPPRGKQEQEELENERQQQQQKQQGGVDINGERVTRTRRYSNPLGALASQLSSSPSSTKTPAGTVIASGDGTFMTPNAHWTGTIQVMNEVVIDRGPSPYLGDLEVYCDGKLVTTVQGDGLIVGTPTGSTAYSVSAGGSMVHPSVPAILITPICPHTLSFRPILVPDTVEIKIIVSLTSRNMAYASFDGRNRQELCQGDGIIVKASCFPVPTVNRRDQSADWFNSLSRCLGWNERQRQLPFNEDLPDIDHDIPTATRPALSRRFSQQ
eukprot:Opistho-2@23186